jgi:hypothetical protein
MCLYIYIYTWYIEFRFPYRVIFTENRTDGKWQLPFIYGLRKIAWASGFPVEMAAYINIYAAVSNGKQKTGVDT